MLRAKWNASIFNSINIVQLHFDKCTIDFSDKHNWNWLTIQFIPATTDKCRSTFVLPFDTNLKHKLCWIETVVSCFDCTNLAERRREKKADCKFDQIKIETNKTRHVCFDLWSALQFTTFFQDGFKLCDCFSLVTLREKFEIFLRSRSDRCFISSR